MAFRKKSNGARGARSRDTFAVLDWLGLLVASAPVHRNLKESTKWLRVPSQTATDAWWLFLPKYAAALSARTTKHSASDGRNAERNALFSNYTEHRWSRGERRGISTVVTTPAPSALLDNHQPLRWATVVVPTLRTIDRARVATANRAVRGGRRGLVKTAATAFPRIVRTTATLRFPLR